MSDLVLPTSRVGSKPARKRKAEVSQDWLPIRSTRPSLRAPWTELLTYVHRVGLPPSLTYLIQFFDFHTTKLEHTLTLPSTAVSILLHRDSGLLAVICDDMVVRVVDVETRRVVRELGGFRARVLDIVSGLLFATVVLLTFRCRRGLPIPGGLLRRLWTRLYVLSTSPPAG